MMRTHIKSIHVFANTAPTELQNINAAATAIPPLLPYQ